MKRIVILTAVILATSVVAFSAVEQEGGPNPKQLIGSWRMVSATYDGQPVPFPGMTTVKHVTPEQFMWAHYDDQDGEVSAALGGTYAIDGESYAETPTYGLDTDQLKGKTHRYTWKVDGNRWLLKGRTADGLVIDEVWERVEKKYARRALHPANRGRVSLTRA